MFAGRAPGLNPGFDFDGRHGLPGPFEISQSPEVFLDIRPVNVDDRIEQFDRIRYHGGRILTLPGRQGLDPSIGIPIKVQNTPHSAH